MVTAADKPGRQTYERSAILLMLKAFYDVVGREQMEHVRVEFSLSNALFCRARGSFTLDNTLLHRIEDRMRELVRQVLPIEKQSVDIEDAAAFLTDDYSICRSCRTAYKYSDYKSGTEGMLGS